MQQYIENIKFARCQFVNKTIHCQLYEEVPHQYSDPKPIMDVVARDVYIDENVPVSLNEKGISIFIPWARHDNHDMNVRIGNHVDGGKILNFSADWHDKWWQEESRKEEEKRNKELEDYDPDPEEEMLARQAIELGIDAYGDEIPNWTAGDD